MTIGSQIYGVFEVQVPMIPTPGSGITGLSGNGFNSPGKAWALSGHLGIMDERRVFLVAALVVENKKGEVWLYSPNAR